MYTFGEFARFQLLTHATGSVQRVISLVGTALVSCKVQLHMPLYDSASQSDRHNLVEYDPEMIRLPLACT